MEMLCHEGFDQVEYWSRFWHWSITVIRSTGTQIHPSKSSLNTAPSGEIPNCIQTSWVADSLLMNSVYHKFLAYGRTGPAPKCQPRCVLNSYRRFRSMTSGTPTDLSTPDKPEASLPSPTLLRHAPPCLPIRSQPIPTVPHLASPARPQQSNSSHSQPARPCPTKPFRPDPYMPARPIRTVPWPTGPRQSCRSDPFHSMTRQTLPRLPVPARP